MKRSKMVELIMHTFEMQGSGTLMRKKDADAILHHIEKAGMLPPLDYHSYYMDGDNADIKSIIYHTWEKE